MWKDKSNAKVAFLLEKRGISCAALSPNSPVDPSCTFQWLVVACHLCGFKTTSRRGKEEKEETGGWSSCVATPPVSFQSALFESTQSCESHLIVFERERNRMNLCANFKSLDIIILKQWTFFLFLHVQPLTESQSSNYCSFPGWHHKAIVLRAHKWLVLVMDIQPGLQRNG